MDRTAKPMVVVTKCWRIGLAILIAIAVGFLTAFVSESVTHVIRNTDAIRANCETRNEQITAVNKKFAEHDAIFFETRVKTDADQGIQTPPEILQAYEEYQKPIPLVSCENLDRGDRQK